MEQNDNDIMVSVICPAYNHEKYIRKALEGFVMQKTNFKYEVFVHDDASTDKTAEIIKEYAEKYPDIIKPIFQKENQYSKGTKFVKTYIYPLMKGKYVAFCEGDDCWTDENKLQLQFDAMEQHPECSFCAHYVKWVEVNGGRVEKCIPDITDHLQKGVVSKELQAELMLGSFQFQFTSYFIRKTYYDDYMLDPPKFVSMMPSGDEAILAYFSVKGKLYFIDREMSIYNHGTEGSWTQRIGRNKIKFREHLKKLINATQELYINFLEEDCQREVVNKKFRYFECLEAYDNGNYKILMTKKYNELFKKYPFKCRLKVYIACIFPRLVQWYDKRKENKNNGK